MTIYTRVTYRQYRSYGHGPLGAAILATPFSIWIGGAIIVGLILSRFL